MTPYMHNVIDTNSFASGPLDLYMYILSIDNKFKLKRVIELHICIDIDFISFSRNSNAFPATKPTTSVKNR